MDRRHFMKQSALIGTGVAMLNASASLFAQQADKIAVPTANEVLAIAKKYYVAQSAALGGELKAEFSGKAGAVTFDGKSNDKERAEALCTDSAAITLLSGDGNFAVASAAAAVGWAKDFPRSANALASVLAYAQFIADENRLQDAKQSALYAISLDDKDADFYLTLAKILHALKDKAGALAALDKALALEPENNAALLFKKFITSGDKGAGTASVFSIFGGGGGGDTKTVGPPISENEGDLSKRVGEQEKKGKEQDPPKSDDSKEEAYRKLQEIETLEAVTPADMVEAVFPEHAKRLREKIVTLTAKDKISGLPEFPSGMLNDAYFLKGNEEYGYDEEREEQFDKYLEWIYDWARRASDRDPKVPPCRETYGIQTSVDYMMEYNRQVILAAIRNYGQYLARYADEVTELRKRTDKIKHQKQDEAWEENVKKTVAIRKEHDASHEIAWRGGVGCPLDPEDCHHGPKLEAVELEYRKAHNAAREEALKVLIPAWRQYYNSTVKEGQLLWERMLPYCRCLDHEGERFAHRLHQTIIFKVADALGKATEALRLNSAIYRKVDGAEIQELADLAQYMEAEAQHNADLLQGFTVSVEAGPFEFKLASNKVELEYVNGAACRVAFDWKAKEMEAGVGVGKKAKIGKSGAVEVSAKTYLNFVIDMRKNEVVDITASAEAKGKVGSFEGGGQFQVSLLGKGVQMTTQSKQSLRSFGFEYDQEIIKYE